MMWKNGECISIVFRTNFEYLRWRTPVSLGRYHLTEHNIDNCFLCWKYIINRHLNDEVEFDVPSFTMEVGFSGHLDSYQAPATCSQFTRLPVFSCYFCPWIHTPPNNQDLPRATTLGGRLVKSVKCYPGGRKSHFILSISEILSHMWYHCVQYTSRHLMSTVSHC